MESIIVERSVERGISSPLPSTPPPARSKSAQSDGSTKEKSVLASPPTLSASMTPPPSTQPPRYYSPTPRTSAINADPLLASPPTTIQAISSVTLPTPDAIASANIEDLRNIARDLVAAVRDARMSAAHFKLQHSLLAMETQEAAQRAEVEHQMTRREVEVLQASEQRYRATVAATPRSSQPPQPQIDALTRTCKDLEEERDETENQLQRVKKLLDLEKDKAELLVEENRLLKGRIRENREHFSRLKSQSPIYATPRDAFTTPQRKAIPQFSDNTPAHAPFAALIAADQILSQESISVPSTPTKTYSSKVKQGHTRAAHSLSSLHTTPGRTRPVTSDGYTESRSLLIQEAIEGDRHDRDSTISISDAEDKGSDDDIPQSQASSLATDMLRKNPGSQESLRLSQNAERSSTLLQTKLFGNVKKPGMERSTHSKRRGSFDDIKAKKARLNSGVGLGIGSWT